PPILFAFCSSLAPLDLHSFPTRRSSDLGKPFQDPRQGFGDGEAAPRHPLRGIAIVVRFQDIQRSVAAPSAVVDAEWSIPIALILDRKSTRLNSSHEWISYAVFCLKKKKN